MNASHELQQSITQKDYDRFTQLLDSGVDVTQRIFDNNTVLHLLACVDWKLSATLSVVKSLFGTTPTIVDWLTRISLSMPKTMTLKEFFSLQNDLSQTCMHTAITNENWIFAEVILKSFNLRYGFNVDMCRDQGGLTESERFLILYGLKGRVEQFQMLFGKRECSIASMKSACKAFKIVKLNNERFALLPSSHRIFRSANELSYPEPYAEIDDPLLLEQVYDENGVEDPNRKVREHSRWALHQELDHISYDGHLHEEREHIRSFLEAYIDQLSARNLDKAYINYCIREFCNEIPRIHSEDLREEVIVDLKKVSALDSFSRYAQLISKLIAKFNKSSSSS